MTKRFAYPVVCALYLMIIAGCGGSSEFACERDWPRYCHESNNAEEAVPTTVMAAGVWAVAGCTVNGCRPPYTCNKATKLCELTSCENDSACPALYHCDLTTRRCN